MVLPFSNTGNFSYHFGCDLKHLTSCHVFPSLFIKGKRTLGKTFRIPERNRCSWQVSGASCTTQPGTCPATNPGAPLAQVKLAHVHTRCHCTSALQLVWTHFSLKHHEHFSEEHIKHKLIWGNVISLRREGERAPGLQAECLAPRCLQDFVIAKNKTIFSVVGLLC